MHILTDKTVITRKEHRCFACAIRYPAGTKMEYQTNVYEDSINSLYTCTGCIELMRRFRDVFVDDGVFPQDCVRESIWDSKVKTPEELLEKWIREERTRKGLWLTVNGRYVDC